MTHFPDSKVFGFDRFYLKQKVTIYNGFPTNANDELQTQRTIKKITP